MIFTGKRIGCFDEDASLNGWCLEVTEEEYHRVVGDEIYAIEKKFRDTMKHPWACPPNKPWRLYPEDLFKAAGIESDVVSFELKGVW